MPHNKKQNNKILLFAGIIILSGLLLGTLIGTNIAPKEPPKSSPPENILKTMSANYRVSSPCNCNFDASIGITAPNNSSVTYNNTNKTLRIKVSVENRGNKTLKNISWSVKNLTTNQTLKVGTKDTILPKTGYIVFNNSISADRDGNPLKLAQGENNIVVAIEQFFDQNLAIVNADRETNTANNSYTQTPPPRIPTVDLEPISYTAGAYLDNRELKTEHQLTVKNNGDNTAESGDFAGRIELNGVRDGVINFSSIQGGSEVTSKRTTGYNALSEGYNFMRAKVDYSNDVVEINDSLVPPLEEINNVYNAYILKQNDAVADSGQYSESTTWFIKTPYVQENTKTIKIPIINISQESQTISPAFSLFSSSDCSGEPIALNNPPQEGEPVEIKGNETFDSYLNLSNSEMQELNDKNICVMFTNSGNLKRSFYIGFPDIIITNYEASVTDVEPHYIYQGSSLTNSEKGIVHRITVKNNGNAEVKNVTIDVYSNGHTDGTRAIIPSLQAGEEQPITINPLNNALEGFNLVKIITDKDNANIELDDTNNKIFREVKIENNQINEPPRIYNESETYYMYKPKVNISGNFKSYMVTLAVIGDYTEENPLLPSDIRFTSYFSNGFVSGMYMMGNWGNWITGEFKAYPASTVTISHCNIKTEFKTRDNENPSYPPNPQSVFLNTDISPDAQCID